MTVRELSESEAVRVEAFGLHVPAGADDGIRYSVDDPDPTPDSSAVGPCGARGPRVGMCTWPYGHTHPQHVAGTGVHVLAVWDAAPAAAQGSERARLVGLLRTQEKHQRDVVASLRVALDQAGPVRVKASQIIAAEAAADAYAHAVEIVEGMAL